MSFDDGVTSIETDANDYAVQYGLPVVSSPLTVTLPYAPAPGSTPPSSEVVLDNRDYGPPQQWAELGIVESLDKVQQGFTAREYDFDLDSGSSLPLNPILAQNGTGALYSQLLAYEQNQTAFTFGEYAEEYNTQTGQSIAGIGYRANAFVTDIQQTPEPSTFPIVSAAAIALALKRRCRATLP
ncbi:MAG: hypothetical protein JO022_08420 [Acidobacteriaceae bacterium]|nr:hypothetical protein [Acidobacteriaceae bacterium]